MSTSCGWCSRAGFDECFCGTERPQPSVNMDILDHETVLEALEETTRLIEEALPKFNWGASALDANAIRLLNETPAKVAKALAIMKESR